MVAAIAGFLLLGSTDQSPADGAFLRTLDCSQKGGAFEGTDLIALSLEENAADRVTLAAQFDGDVPPAVVNPRRGSISLAVTFYVFPSQDAKPYYLYVTTLFGGSYAIQAGRFGGGQIDSSGMDLAVAGDTIRVSFTPNRFAELRPATRFGISADTIVQEFVQEPQQLGYVERATERCPASSSADSTEESAEDGAQSATTSPTTASPTTATPPTTNPTTTTTVRTAAPTSSAASAMEAERVAQAFYDFWVRNDRRGASSLAFEEATEAMFSTRWSPPHEDVGPCAPVQGEMRCDFLYLGHMASMTVIPFEDGGLIVLEVAIYGG